MLSQHRQNLCGKQKKCDIPLLRCSPAKIWSVPQGLNPHCPSLCKCSPRFNLWRVQPDVLCNDVVWGMTRASREAAARLQMLLSEREQVVVWRLGTHTAMSCLIAAVTLELWNVDMGSPAQEVRAAQLQHWGWQTHCIMLPNIFATSGRGWYVTPHKHCNLWARCCHCTPALIYKIKVWRYQDPQLAEGRKTGHSQRSHSYFEQPKLHEFWQMSMFLLQFWTCKIYIFKETSAKGSQAPEILFLLLICSHRYNTRNLPECSRWGGHDGLS